MMATPPKPRHESKSSRSPGTKVFWGVRGLVGLFNGWFGVQAYLVIDRTFHHTGAWVASPFVLAVLAVVFWPFPDPFRWALLAIGISALSPFFSSYDFSHVDGQVGFALLLFPAIHWSCLMFLISLGIAVELWKFLMSPDRPPAKKSNLPGSLVDPPSPQEK